jgi:hypothetical protein
MLAAAMPISDQSAVVLAPAGLAWIRSVASSGLDSAIIAVPRSVALASVAIVAKLPPVSGRSR